MVSNAQMVITTWGDDFACSVASPQLPGIVAAYDSHPTALELFNLALAAGLSPDGSVDVHVQKAFEVDGKQFFVRSRHDHWGDERAQLATQIAEELQRDSGLRDYADADRYDDVVVVATLAADRIHDVLVGAEDGQPLTIGMLGSAGDLIHYIGMLSSSGAAEGRRLSDLGLDIWSTIGQMFQTLGIDSSSHQHGRILVTA